MTTNPLRAATGRRPSPTFNAHFQRLAATRARPGGHPCTPSPSGGEWEAERGGSATEPLNTPPSPPTPARLEQEAASRSERKNGGSRAAEKEGTRGAPRDGVTQPSAPPCLGDFTPAALDVSTRDASRM
ncbi:Hypothetical protein NTJ_02802 [Nesidiocoris tenuis]|uniref:Uncharacterized protein n=1 Tax=Nesidiocoris tenuis TaxID=355587 RepID=A0ABN7ACJ5_9HEMI|nr:Hypothetical protein NTJ_02802 [Nesidiocoris tenuis]